LAVLSRDPLAVSETRDLLYYVGVHHKAGTVWMWLMHQAIARRLDLPFIDLGRPGRSGSSRGAKPVDPALLGSTLQRIRAQRRGIVFDPHSVFGEVPKQIPRIRGVHIVRDPRDVLISATFYHLKADERWLDQPMPYLRGMTYREKLHSFGTIREAFIFELRNQTQKAIRAMASFPRLPTVATVTYESLMTGDVLAAFAAMFASLGFRGPARGVALECARQESIVLNPTRRRSSHVRSGELHQWRHAFDRELGELFVAEAGNALIALGYEPDHSWLKELPATRPALDKPLPVPEREADERVAGASAANRK
jgi:hypothetical protein